MTAEEYPIDPVDRLVRQYVDREVEKVDAAKLVAGVRAAHRKRGIADRHLHRSPHSPARRLRVPRTRSVTWTVMTALATVAAFVGGRYLAPQSANAADVLRTMQSAHYRAIDHCYRIEFAPDPRFWDGKNKLEGPTTSVLWTRGDRFWSDSSIGDLRLSIGRDVDSVLWISPSSSKGIQFTNDPTELPESVRFFCEVSSMSVPQLVDEVLADFDLSAEVSAGAKTLVWARLKPGHTHPLLSDAVLEIDPKTDVLDRLVLWTVRDGRPNGTFTYSLVESSLQSDERYRLESHLDEDAELELHTLPATSNQTRNGR